MKENSVAEVDIQRKLFVGCRNDSIIPFDGTRRQNESCSGNQMNRRSIFQCANAHLGSLQILQDRDRSGSLYRCAPDQVEDGSEKFMIAVRKIETKTINSGSNQPFNHVSCTGGRPKGSKDFCATQILLQDGHNVNATTGMSQRKCPPHLS